MTEPGMEAANGATWKTVAAGINHCDITTGKKAKRVERLATADLISET